MNLMSKRCILYPYTGINIYVISMYYYCLIFTVREMLMFWYRYTQAGLNVGSCEHTDFHKQKKYLKKTRIHNVLPRISLGPPVKIIDGGGPKNVFKPPTNLLNARSIVFSASTPRGCPIQCN